MKVVIDIPGWLYNAIMECKEPHYSKSLGEAVRDGTPLPKRHGRLIDVDILVDGFEDNYEFCEVVNATPTIIEADKDCTDCILDGTDACTRGAGRAVDAEVCEDFLGEEE